jgi:serine phosphatase RsbU (regulator of sigma subunit)
VSVVKGGAAANTLVKAMDSPWGRELYSGTLIRNIGASCYKVRGHTRLALEHHHRQQQQQQQQRQELVPAVAINWQVVGTVVQRQLPAIRQQVGRVCFTTSEPAVIEVQVHERA